MKILCLHCDYIKFKALKKALRNPEELTSEWKEGVLVEDSLVVLTAIEKQDEGNVNVVEEFVNEIVSVSGQVGCKNIVLYPYAHLSVSLSSPNFALDVLQKTEKELKGKKFSVSRAPFGYYKEFELKVKGHPLSELSREIKFSGSLDSGEIYDYKKLLNEISKGKLDTRKLKENDHRIIGQKMDLFSFSETAPGMVFWHNNGLIIFNELVKFWREEHRKSGYEEIKTPQVLDKKLWQISGHWEKYRENIFLTDYEGREFAVKPMNCPGGMLVYKNSTKSYRDFPLRVGELGVVHRQELSGVLGGLFRVIQFTQDDAHIFCTEKQVEGELVGVIDLIDRFYKLFGFDYFVELSTRPEKRIGSDKIWDKAESVLEKVLKKKKMKFKVNKGDGAFYGPKIDFHIKDSLGRTWQMGTLQLDFAMPERFDLSFVDKDNKIKRPVMLHRVVYGSIERFIGILLEHYKGHLPVWLSPVQVRVINYTDRNNKSCEDFCNELKEKGLRFDVDLSQEPLGGKIRQAEVEKIPYIIVIGDKEEKAGEVAVRVKGKVKNYKKGEFVDRVVEEVEGQKGF